MYHPPAEAPTIVRAGNATALRYLIEHGLDVNKPVDELGTTLLDIAEHQGHTKLVKLLRDAGARKS